MKKESIVILDFGGQYKELIARRVRECGVYTEVHPYTMSLDAIREMNPAGIIFTGGPNSVYAEDSPSYTADIFDIPLVALYIPLEYGVRSQSSLCVLVGLSVFFASGRHNLPAHLFDGLDNLL